MTTPTVEEIVIEYAKRLESTDFSGNIGTYVLVVKDSNDANSGVPIEIEKEWLRTTLTTYGNARYEEGVKAGREEAVSYIGYKQGWEESEDVYREHFGLPTKYKRI